MAVPGRAHVTRALMGHVFEPWRQLRSRRGGPFDLLCAPILSFSFFLPAIMSTTTENSFRNSLRNFNLTSSSNARISLPTDSPAASPLDNIRTSASSWFSNMSSQVQGYLPVNTGEEEEEPWFQLSRMEVWTPIHKKLRQLTSYFFIIIIWFLADHGFCPLSWPWHPLLFLGKENRPNLERDQGRALDSPSHSPLGGFAPL